MDLNNKGQKNDHFFNLPCFELDDEDPSLIFYEVICEDMPRNFHVDYDCVYETPSLSDFTQ